MSYLAFANITEILGKPELAAEFRAKAKTVADQINAKFLNTTTGAYAVTGDARHSTGGSTSQAGQGMARFEGIVPQELRQSALEVMAANANAAEYIKGPSSGSYKKNYTGEHCPRKVEGALDHSAGSRSRVLLKTIWMLIDPFVQAGRGHT